MKIGIISELHLIDVNFGSRLQALALNHCLNQRKSTTAISIIYEGNILNKRTKISIVSFIKKLIIKNPVSSQLKKNYSFENRIKKFNDFLNQTTKYLIVQNIEEINSQNFDVLIVGSDVVWAQYEHGFDRLKFLDFPISSKTRKVSYAASFGRDWIPKENVKKIKMALNDFYKISVRESSSVEFLKTIGVNNAVHVCDPTLLLSREDWKKYEKKPDFHVKGKYIFTYLLGKNIGQRTRIQEMAKELNLVIVNVHHANGEYHECDENFTDYNINDCSPEEWLWLIEHSEYVFTDSFHCTIFSTIFHKKFLVFSRDYSRNINNRLIDFLKNVKQEDKFIEQGQNISILDFTWNYSVIDNCIDKLVGFSKQYIDSCLLKHEGDYHD